jgi:hypothetical protein
MPKDKCSRIPQSFLPRRELTRDLTPREFLEYYYHLRHVITTAETDIQTIMHFRGWRAHGASSGPDCRMRKSFPGGRTLETSDKIAPGIEEHLCYLLEAQPGAASPPPPPPERPE